MFALAAAMFEIIDLALDQVLKAINASSMQTLQISIAIIESVIGMAAVLMIYFALERVFFLAISNERNKRKKYLESRLYIKYEKDM